MASRCPTCPSDKPGLRYFDHSILDENRAARPCRDPWHDAAAGKAGGGRDGRNPIGDGTAPLSGGPSRQPSEPTDTKEVMPTEPKESRSRLHSGRESTAAATPHREEVMSTSDSLREKIEREMRANSLEGTVIAILDAVSVAEKLVRRERDELERERTRLAGCGVAALGYVQEPVPEYGDSASLQDVLRLRKRAEAAERMLDTSVRLRKEAEERAVEAQNDAETIIERIKQEYGERIEVAEKERDEWLTRIDKLRDALATAESDPNADTWRSLALAHDIDNRRLEKALAEQREKWGHAMGCACGKRPGPTKNTYMWYHDPVCAPEAKR